MNANRANFNSSLLPRTFHFGFPPEAILAALKSHLCARVVQGPLRICDIGAGAGVHALALARAFPGATVHATEPAPDMFSLLALNEELARRDVRNLFTHRLAADEFHEAFPRHFDVVHWNLVMHFSGGWEVFLTDVQGTAASGAHLAFMDFCLPDAYGKRELRTVQAFLGEVLGFRGTIPTLQRLCESLEKRGFEILEAGHPERKAPIPASTGAGAESPSGSALLKSPFPPERLRRRREILWRHLRENSLNRDALSLETAMPIARIVSRRVRMG